LDGCLALTKREHRVRFPAGAPHPGTGSLMAGRPSTRRPGTAGPAAGSAWSGYAALRWPAAPSECDADRAEGSADRGTRGLL